MSYQLRWMQPRDGAVVPQTHDFDDRGEAEEFAKGLGPDARAELFDTDAKGGDAEKPVWSSDTPQATEKERDGARAANVVGKSEGSGPNTKPDTRDEKPEDLKELMGNKPQGDATQPARPMNNPAGATPAGARNLDADKGSGDQNAQGSRDGSNNRGTSQDGGGSGKR